jgi:hypothetical protein
MMSIFTPPTDNLYKFLAVSGVVLIVAGAYYPPVFFRQTGMEYLEQLRGSKELEVQEEFGKERLETLELREQQALDQKNKLQKRLAELKSSSNSTEVDKLEGRVKEANREIESIVDSASELRLNLAMKRAQVKHEETVSINGRRDSRLVLIVGGVGVLIGIFFAVAGFCLWYKKVQRFQDRVVTKETRTKVATVANEQIKSTQLNQPTKDNVPEPTT